MHKLSVVHLLIPHATTEKTSTVPSAKKQKAGVEWSYHVHWTVRKVGVVVKLGHTSKVASQEFAPGHLAKPSLDPTGFATGTFRFIATNKVTLMPRVRASLIESPCVVLTR